jgi:N-acyl-L-homoserine lactone synthetase
MERTMIECFDFASAHHFGNVLAEQFRLRHRVFVQRASYDVPCWREMEYDRYDTPATTYLVWRDEGGIARGVSRLSPTDRPYMVKDVWPSMVSACPLPASTAVWEGTRFGVDKDLAPALRRRIVSELVLGYLEFGLAEGVKQIIGVMPTLIWRAVFSSNGWPVEFLGEPRVLGADRCVAGMLALSPEVLARVRARTGIFRSVVRYAGVDAPLERDFA